MGLFFYFLSCNSSEIEISILTPTNKSAFESNAPVEFVANLQHTTKGDDVDLIWNSSRDGMISQYTTDFITDDLSMGFHHISIQASWQNLSQEDHIYLYIGDSNYIEEPKIELIDPNDETVLSDIDVRLRFSVFDQQTALSNLHVSIYENDDLICDGKANEQGFFDCTTQFSTGPHNLSATSLH